jgi:cytochrome c-type protein NapC
MEPYVRDVSNRQSKSLAAAHSHNPWFGNESCYVCHADYAMFGTVTTKLSGMGHMWAFYSGSSGK